MTSEAGHTHEKRGPRLTEYVYILSRRRWLVVASVLSIVTTVGLLTLRATPLYRAVAILQIERLDPNIMKFQEIAPYDPSFLSYQDYYQTQYQLLRSRAVAARAVSRLALSADPEFGPAPAGLLSRLLGSLTKPLRAAVPGGAASDAETRCVDAVLAGTSVDPVRNTHLVEVGFVSPSPAIAARVANGVADAYISFGLDTRLDTSETAHDFLSEQATKLRDDVAALERALQEYGKSKEIIPTSDSRNTTLSALEDLQRAFTAAQAERAEKEGTWAALRQTPDAAVPQVSASPLIQGLAADVAQLEREQAEMAKRFKPEWPARARLDSKLAQAKERLSEETKALAASARESAESAMRASVGRERNLGALLDRQKQAAIQLSSDSIEYTNLRAEVEKKRETLDQILKRESEIALSSHLRDPRQSNIRVIDPARVPERVYRPNRKLNLALALVTGLLVGLGLALLAEHLDNTVKSAEEVRRLTHLPVIGVIPEHREVGPRPLAREDPEETPSPRIDLITHSDPKTPLAEAYKELRTATLLASPDSPPRTLLVTSCLPQEGKSQTCLNLAIALAQSGRRVLLVDTDLRRPRLHRALGLDNRRGISTYLSGNAELASLVRASLVPGLDALTSGPTPPNPSELLGSRSFAALAREFPERAGYDHLVFDSPPLLSVADPIVVASVLEGTILVVHCARTPHEALARGAGKLAQAGIKVLGAVLNSVGENERPYYYGALYRSEPGEERAPGRGVSS